MADEQKTIEELRTRLQSMTEEAIYNEAVLRRFQARELTLLTAGSLAELMARLTEGLKNSFQVEAVHLIIADPDQEYRNILHNSGAHGDDLSGITFADQLEGINPLIQELTYPELSPWKRGRHAKLILPAINEQVRSIAVMPLILGAKTVGCLSLGSTDEKRFNPNQGTDFLHRLATIAAVSLENMLNREKLVLSGLTDPLTGLHNRRYLEGRLREEVARAARYRQPLSCLFVDADFFKRINDNYGHAAGDVVLKELAQRVRSQLRTSDIATRYGGEEFVILLPQTGRDEAIVLAERIRQLVASKPIELESGRQIYSSVSIGVSESHPAPHAKNKLPLGEQLLIEADNALYLAKAQGRNRVVLHRRDAMRGLEKASKRDQGDALNDQVS